MRCAAEGDKDCDGGLCGKAGAFSSASSSDASGVNCGRGAVGGAIERAAIGDVGARPPRTLASVAAGLWIDMEGELVTGEASESDTPDTSGAFLLEVGNGALGGEASCSSI